MDEEERSLIWNNRIDVSSSDRMLRENMELSVLEEGKLRSKSKTDFKI